MLPQDGSTGLYWLKWLIKLCMASVHLNRLNHPLVYIHCNTTPCVLQMECTLHYHAHKLVFFHTYTPIALCVLKIYVHKIATLQCHSMHFSIFALRNTPMPLLRHALCLPPVEHINQLIDIQAIFGFWTRFTLMQDTLRKHWPNIIFTIWQQKSTNEYIYIVKLVLHFIWE